jgi:very-short-patch-repair endonuclease
VPDRSYRQHAGIRIHRPIALSDTDIEDVDGIPCTTVARTLVDLAAVVNPRELERALKQADHQHTLDVAAVGEVLGRIARPRGVRTLRALLQAALPETATRAEHEEAFLRLASRYNLPPFLMNQPVALAEGRYAVIDVLFPIQRVALELDTYATHGTPLAFARDRRRDAELSAIGYHPMRLTYADTTYDGARSMRLLIAVLERADGEPRHDRARRAAG